MSKEKSKDKEESSAAPFSSEQLLAVWVVVGETGEYSDYQEWNVIAFTTESKATQFKDMCQSEADKVNGKDYRVRESFKSSYDPQFGIDYTGTSYRVEMLRVTSDFPANKLIS